MEDGSDKWQDMVRTQAARTRVKLQTKPQVSG
jgi:hypothetical protein